jgi:hypothetical protein
MIKAVVVGINLYQNFPDQTLKGCINDAQDVMSYLTDKLGVAHADIYPLFDSLATKDAIMQALHDMIASSGANDMMLFHFSGHGAQLVSDSASESDGLDEVLCPTDFDFGDRSTALTDKEIAALLGSISPGRALTILADACHSGTISDMKPLTAKGDRARFLRPPADYAWRLEGRKPVVSRSFDNPAGVTVSACADAETAADTSFNGRANGAFTYNWLAALAATPQASMDTLLTDVAKTLAGFNMHPEIHGAAPLRASTFLIDPPPVIRALRAPSVGAPRMVPYTEKWSSSVAGLPVSVELSVTQADDGFLFQITPQVAGFRTTIPITASGDFSYPIPIPYVGVLNVGVSGWSLGNGKLDFDLTLTVTTSIPFVPPLRLCREHISVPLDQAQKALPTPQTAAEFVAMLQLLQLTGSAPQPYASVVGRDVTVIDDTPHDWRQGDAGWGPNWRENRRIVVDYLPPDQERVAVNLSAQNGSGNVYLVGWSSDDPHDPSFVLHMGNSLVGGWGSIHWTVTSRNAYEIPNRGLGAPIQRDTNGQSRPSQSEPLIVMPVLKNGSMPA